MKKVREELTVSSLLSVCVSQMFATILFFHVKEMTQYYETETV